MTEEGASRTLAEFLQKLVTDARLINPSRPDCGIWMAHQENPRPSGAYATVQFISDQDLTELDDEKYSIETIAGEPRPVMCKLRGVEWLFRVTVFAPRPIDWCRLFSSGLRSGEAGVWMAPLVVRDVRQIERNPMLVQQDWEGRAQFDVALGAVASEPLLVDVIETGEVMTNGAGGSTVTAGFTYTKP